MQESQQLKVAREFAAKENQIYILLTEEWLGRHIYSDIHEYFFYNFWTILYEWLAQLSYQKTKFQGGEPTYWTLEMIQQLKELD